MKRIDYDELDYDYKELATTYQGKRFSGISCEIEPPGNRVEVTFANGVPHGPTRVFSRSGQLIEESYYQFGTQHGPSMEWDENGQKKRLRKFERGILVEEIEWDASGKPIKEFHITAAHPNYNQLLNERGISYPDWSLYHEDSDGEV